MGRSSWLIGRPHPNYLSAHTGLLVFSSHAWAEGFLPVLCKYNFLLQHTHKEYSLPLPQYVSCLYLVHEPMSCHSESSLSQLDLVYHATCELTVLSLWKSLGLGVTQRVAFLSPSYTKGSALISQKLCLVAPGLPSL